MGMSYHGLASRIATTATAIGLLIGSATAIAQSVPTDLTTLPPVAKTFAPKTTAWGDPDLRGTWPLDNINVSRIPFQRLKEYGNRFWLTDEEFAKRLAAAKASDAAFNPDNARGSTGLAKWIETTPFAHRTSMLVSPTDGQLPPLIPKAEALSKDGRSSWIRGKPYDWIDDFDVWDRCITRGFPASMMPFRYNNGLRIFQAPGYVVIHLEMLGDRIIPIGDNKHEPRILESWMGDSRGHWEGKTLVIETTNIRSGDNATRDLAHRVASPLNVATQGVPPGNSIPTSEQAKAIERLTMTDANTITYEMTYTDPEVFTAPWTARYDWTRDGSYQMFEYACHEGNVQIRNYIVASRAERAKKVAGGK